MAQSASTSYVEPKKDSPTVIADVPNAENRVRGLEDLTKNILVVIVISLAAMVIAVLGIVLDQIHFNNELYRDGDYNHKEVIEKVVHDKPVQLTFPNVNQPN